MKATEILKEEHKAIELMLEILEKIAQKLEKREEISSQHLQKILEFIKVFADRCHHGKEEDLLFPAMEKAGIPKENDILYPMAEMHLDSKADENLTVGFEKLEKEKIGPGKHEEFHRLLESLQRAYL